jgi:IclR family acetate operon transcriptional repressor
MFALPIIRDLGLAGGETVNLGRIKDGKLIFLARFEPHAGRCSAPGLSNLPAHCSSIGKAILGATREPELPGLPQPWPTLTPNSIRSPAELLRQLKIAHQTGFAVDDEENTVGLRCVAAPIFDQGHRPVAAISVAAPAERLPKNGVASCAAIVAAAARRITHAIGGAEPRRA